MAWVNIADGEAGSSVRTKLNALGALVDLKAPIAAPTFTGVVTFAGGASVDINGYMTGGGNNGFTIGSKAGAQRIDCNGGTRFRFLTAADAFAEIQAEYALMNSLSVLALGNYVDDAAAAAGGVAVGQFYRNGSVVMVRVV